ncbi:MAG: hypothetical protein M1825_001732 [Sarcosagium campestre]|nr:MAG: hypothetical protein M1825_001732 [Sarcosagium campestre]
MPPIPEQVEMWNSPRVVNFYKSGERITGPYARLLVQQARFVEWCKQRDDVGSGSRRVPVVLDNACGTGVVSKSLYQLLAEDESTKNDTHLDLDLTCGDFSAGMVEYMQQYITAEGWTRARAQVLDAQKTGLPDAHFTHVFTAFGFMLMADPIAALTECFRILKSGGVCALSTWEEISWVDEVREAIATIPDAPPFPETHDILRSWSTGDWFRPGYVEKVLRQHGFVDVQVHSVPNTSSVGTAEKFAEVFTPMTTMATKSAWTDEQRERIASLIQPAIVKYLTDKYGEDKEINTKWVAILATGSKPHA